MLFMGLYCFRGSILYRWRSVMSTVRSSALWKRLIWEAQSSSSVHTHLKFCLQEKINLQASCTNWFVQSTCHCSLSHFTFVKHFHLSLENPPNLHSSLYKNIHISQQETLVWKACADGPLRHNDVLTVSYHESRQNLSPTATSVHFCSQWCYSGVITARSVRRGLSCETSGVANHVYADLCSPTRALWTALIASILQHISRRVPTVSALSSWIVNVLMAGGCCCFLLSLVHTSGTAVQTAFLHYSGGCSSTSTNKLLANQAKRTQENMRKHVWWDQPSPSLMVTSHELK